MAGDEGARPVESDEDIEGCLAVADDEGAKPIELAENNDEDCSNTAEEGAKLIEPVGVGGCMAMARGPYGVEPTLLM